MLVSPLLHTRVAASSIFYYKIALAREILLNRVSLSSGRAFFFVRLSFFTVVSVWEGLYLIDSFIMIAVSFFWQKEDICNAEKKKNAIGNLAIFMRDP